MHILAERMLRTIRRYGLIAPGGRVVAAVSGGADSVAMAFLLRELDAAGELVCAGLAHANHRLRDDAARDQAFAVALAARLGLPIEAGDLDVHSIKRARRTSIENAARIARYEFLEAGAERLGADRVAVGHTLDDQAETFLMRVIRGSGRRGLRGIHPRRGVFVRPLLEVARAELRDYLAERGEGFCHDETNDDLSYTRNRVRHELIPLLERRFSPSIARVLARSAEVSSADEDYLALRTGEVFARTVKTVSAGPDQTEVVIDAARLRGEPLALIWRTMLEALRSVDSSGGPAVGLEQARALLEMTAGGAARLDLPGVRAERIGETLVLRKRAGRGRTPAGNSFRYPLSIPGEVWLREAGCAIAADPVSGPRALSVLHDDNSGGGAVAVVSAAALPSRLTVRSRRPGDAFRPLGLGGRKKLQDFFVDRKVGRDRRDKVPLIVDDRDRIVWVAGHAIAEEFRVPDGAQAVVILRLKTAPEPDRIPAEAGEQA